MIESSPMYTIQELFALVDEYFDTHPENDERDDFEGDSPAGTAYEGALDFVHWLAAGKRFLWNEVETYEDLTEEDLLFLQDQALSLLDAEEEENIQRDETY